MTALPFALLAIAAIVPTTVAATGRSIDRLRLISSDGQSWKIDGEADAAELDLRSVPGHNAYWFAWSAFHPGTKVWEGAPIRESAMPAAPGGRCTVPCDEIFQGCRGRDCIPPLDSPDMVPTDSPRASYVRDDDMILGAHTKAGPRAYPHNVLWWHEIVNEDVGGEGYAISFCPLTGSGLRFDRASFVEGRTVRLGVSGLLYNSNLVMWDRETESLWSQMKLEAISGPKIKTVAPLQGVLEMTWKAWKTLHPDTLVVSDGTGFTRDYRRYPYGNYRTDHANTFRGTNPTPDGQFKNKELVFGVIIAGEAKAYVWSRLRARLGDAGVITDQVGGVPIAVVFHFPSRFVHAFERRLGSKTHQLALSK